MTPNDLVSHVSLNLGWHLVYKVDACHGPCVIGGNVDVEESHVVRKCFFGGEDSTLALRGSSPGAALRVTKVTKMVRSKDDCIGEGFVGEAVRQRPPGTVFLLFPAEKLARDAFQQFSRLRSERAHSTGEK